ncbi:MAG: FixH family protein [Bacteriovoracaceae bacterium]
MKSLLLGTLLAVSLSSWASVEKSVCSQTSQVCASIKSDLDFSSEDEVENRFELTLNSKDGKKAELVKIDLWMQMGHHGHGSSPLKVTAVSEGVYDITKAYFMMRGTWQVRVTYKLEGAQETLIVPVIAK